MKLMKNPYINAAVIALISFIYATVFILTSGHIEFSRILKHSQTLKIPFWNNWSAFLQHGNLKYIGYTYIALAVCVIVLSLVRKKSYDEYQLGILATSFIVTGFVLLFLFPVALLLILSDSNYAIEAIMLIIVIHWSVFLIANLIYSVKWCRA